MVTQKSDWQRVSKRKRCPVCDHPDWCMEGAGAVLCMRIKSDKPAKSGGWIHKTGEQPTSFVPVRRKRRESDHELTARWTPRLRHAWLNNGEAMDRLANTIGVARFALDQLQVGWDGSGWWFPERNHRGQVVGINRRSEDGRKICVTGSRRALTYAPDNWLDYDGPVLIVEGGSDVAAGITLGLCVVGRPSNVGGLEYLVKLLGSHAERRLIVIGEKDRKPHDTLPDVARTAHDVFCHGCQLCWPGKYGARKVAWELGRRTGRRVTWKFLPGTAKDLRGWLNLQKLDLSDVDGCFRAGKRLLRRLA